MIGNFYIATDKDRAEEQEREKRRQVELERQKRIFNPRVRKIGVDINVLQSQINERKEKENAEREYQIAFEQQMLKDNQLAILLAAKEKEERKRVSNELNDYRKTYQKQYNSRDYDLIDPNSLKNQVPPRSTDEPVGLPCGQKFEGEDLNAKERAKMMSEQMSSWLQQQMGEKQADVAHQKASEKAYKQAVISRDKRALQLELIERECKKQLESANTRFNQILAEERSTKVNADSQNENEDNLAEVYNTLTSDLMTENPIAGRSVFGPHRTITYMYKGMSPEEKNAIRISQLNQIAEQKAKRENDRKHDIDWEKLMTDMSRAAALEEMENQKIRRDIAHRVKQENLMLSQQQKEKQKYYDKIIYVNEPTEDYFNQFNTSSR